MKMVPNEANISVMVCRNYEGKFYRFKPYILWSWFNTITVRPSIWCGVIASEMPSKKRSPWKLQRKTIFKKFNFGRQLAKKLIRKDNGHNHPDMY